MLRWITVGFAFVFLVLFFPEIIRILQAFWDLMLYIATGKPGLTVSDADHIQTSMLSFLIIVENLLVFGVFLTIFIWLTAQFTLPVRGSVQRTSVYRRLRMYMQGVHGPAIFVREGKQVGTQEETKRGGPGVAFVDHSSAIVLERQSGSGMAARAAGPGIVFPGGGEKIRGTVDLRKQARATPGVHAFTRDGIDLTTNVIAIFTLGQDPDILKVGYVGPLPEDLRVIQIDDRSIHGPNHTVTHYHMIKDLTDELDPVDRNEVFLYYQNVTQTGQYPVPDGSEYKLKERTLFSFDENRVKAAIYSQAYNSQSNTFTQWDDIPGQVAIQILRDLLMQKTYDDWFRSDAEKPAAIRALKPRFGQVMRHQGILAYQFVERADGQYLSKGQPWDESDLIIHPARLFRSNKILRERGIKVLTGVFSDPKPKEQIREQFFNKWQAIQQEEVKSTRSDFDLRVMQIINSSRTRAQKDMLINLSRILQSNQYTQEALALRMFQTLESIASDSSTRKLIPGDTITLLRNLGTWLNVDESGSQAIPPIPPADFLPGFSIEGGSDAEA